MRGEGQGAREVRRLPRKRDPQLRQPLPGGIEGPVRRGASCMPRGTCSHSNIHNRVTTQKEAAGGVLLTADPERTAPHDLLASWSAKMIVITLKRRGPRHKGVELTAKATCSKSHSTSAPLMRRFRGRCRPKRRFRASVPRSRRASRRCVSVRRTRLDAHSVQVARCRPGPGVVVYASSLPASKSSEIPSALRRAAVKESFGCASGHRTCDTP